jgi:hypothetical protein
MLPPAQPARRADGTAGDGRAGGAVHQGRHRSGKSRSVGLQRRQRYEPWWEACLNAYAPSIDHVARSVRRDIHTNRTFTLVERKKADLFYQKPDVTLQPTPLMRWADYGAGGHAAEWPAQSADRPAGGADSAAVCALEAHEEIVNEKLGDDGIDASEMMDAVLFDIVCTQAVGFTKMGYESYTVAQEVRPHDGPAAHGGCPRGGKVLLGALQREAGDHPAQLPLHGLGPRPFLGMQFTLPLTPGNRKTLQAPRGLRGQPSRTRGKQFYDHGDGSTREGDNVFTGRGDLVPLGAVPGGRVAPGSPDAVRAGRRDRRAGH